jgi:hypothetical protein
MPAFIPFGTGGFEGPANVGENACSIIGHGGLRFGRRCAAP